MSCSVTFGRCLLGPSRRLVRGQVNCCGARETLAALGHGQIDRGFGYALQKMKISTSLRRETKSKVRAAEWILLRCTQCESQRNGHHIPRRGFHSSGRVGSSGPGTLEKLKGGFQFSSTGGKLALAKAKVERERFEETLEPLDQLMFQISSDLRTNGRLSRKDIESVVSLLDAGTSVGVHGTFLLSCLGPSLPDAKPSAKVGMAQKIWNAIETEGKLTFESLDAYLRCYAQNEGTRTASFDALSLLRKAQAVLSRSDVDGRELKPTQKTYYYVMLAYCLNGDLSKAIEVLNLVKDEGISVDEEYFNALITGNARSGDLKGARGVLDILTAVNIEPSEKTYGALIQAYIEHNRAADVEKIYNLGVASHIKFPVHRLLNLVNVAATTRNQDAFKKILSWIPASDKLTSDVVNTIVSLVHLGYPDEALQVLVQLSEPEEVLERPFGNFLVKEMINADIELGSIIRVCDKLMEGGQNEYAWNAAAEYSLKYSKFNLTFSIFELMKERNIPIRPHYFWPILIQQFEAEKVEGLLGVIEKMHSYGATPDWETNYEFVVPRMFAQFDSALQVAKVLKESANLSYSSGVLKAILLYLLKQKRLDDASYLVTKVRGTLDHPQTLVDHLLINLLKFDVRENIETNLELALPLLKSIYLNAPTEDKTDFVGNFVVRFVEAVGSGLIDTVNKLVQSLSAEGIRFSQDAASWLQSQKHLTISTLNVNPDSVFVRDNKVFLKPKEMSTRDLASHAEELKAKEMNERGTLRLLFLKYCQTYDLNKILAVKERFEQHYGELSPGMSAALFGVYVRLKKLDAAKDLFKSLRTQEDLEIDVFKIIDLATLMAENNLTEDASNLVMLECSNQNIKSHDPKSTVRNVAALLEALQRNDSRIGSGKELLDFLLEKNLVEPSSPVLGIPIKQLITNGDLEGAVDLFLDYTQKYNVTPCRQQLTCAILVSDRSDLLEKVSSCCKQRYGDINSRHNIAFSMSDVDNITGAASILAELVQLERIRPDMIMKQAQFHGTRREMKKLLNLIETVSKSVPSFDCTKMYLIALKTCEISRDVNDTRLVLSNIQEHEFVSAHILRYSDRLKHILPQMNK